MIEQGRKCTLPDLLAADGISDSANRRFWIAKVGQHVPIGRVGHLGNQGCATVRLGESVAILNSVGLVQEFGRARPLAAQHPRPFRGDFFRQAIRVTEWPTISVIFSHGRKQSDVGKNIQFVAQPGMSGIRTVPPFRPLMAMVPQHSHGAGPVGRNVVIRQSTLFATAATTRLLISIRLSTPTVTVGPGNPAISIWAR